MIAVQQLVAVATGHARDTFDDEAAVAELRQLADGDHQTLERAITGVHGAAGQPLAEPGDRSGAVLVSILDRDVVESGSRLLRGSADALV